MPSQTILAVDLGASSGRVVAGLFDGRRLALEDGHRFENGGLPLANTLHWDPLGLWSNITQGLRAAAAKYGRNVASVGVDTWGVDFGLLGRNDELLGNPYHYRDARTTGILERAFQIVPREEIFAETGLQFMEFNTLYQLVAMKLANSSLLDVAESFLMMPDLFHWLMTGVKANEFTDLSTSQLLNPRTKDYSQKLLERFDIPSKMFGAIAQPGTRLGRLRQAVAEDTGLQNAEVILPGTHDTASAVMAVPAASQSGAQPDWCYISSGTWSLMGIETPQPIINDRCRELNFTNEGGVGGTTRVLKNITGLWMLEQCRRKWNQDGSDLGWTELVARAEAARPLVSLVNPDASCFVAPKDMPQAIRDYCRDTQQPIAQSEGELIRTALESLALRYRMVLAMLEEMVGNQIDTIHIVGGGTQNKLLNQMAADACNRRVVAGPVEATAIGNVMLQAVALGEVASISQAREIIRASFAVEEYHPRRPELWDAAAERFAKLVG
jgi:rhamnulokinase